MQFLASKIDEIGDTMWILGDTWDMNYNVPSQYQQMIYPLILVNYIVSLPCIIAGLWCFVTSTALSDIFTSIKFWLTIIPAQSILLYVSPTYLNLVRYTIYPCFGHYRRQRLAMWKEKMKSMETGWTIAVEVRQSLGRGLGVFACENVSKGTKVYVKKPNLLFFMSSRAEMDAFWKEQNYDEFQKGYFFCHCINDYFGNLIWSFDESMTLVNHEDEPNLVSDPIMLERPKEFGLVASRDIKCGEEMTISYDCRGSGSYPDWYLEHEDYYEWWF